MATIVLEQYKISPANGTELSLPLTFFDMMWYDNLPDRSLLFFEFPCSKPVFLESLVPGLKKSLSLTLPHFLPLAGKIIHPGSHPEKKPIIRYAPGDSVSCTFSIYQGSSAVELMSGNKLRFSNELYCMAPELPPSSCDSDDGGSIACPALALKVTLLPGHGICIGFVTHHAVSDACTVVSFMRAWALIHRNVIINNNDCDTSMKDLLIRVNYFPFYGRRTIMDGNSLDAVYWNLILQNHKSPVRHEKLLAITNPYSVGTVRSTLILKKDEIENLKKYYYILAAKRDNNYLVVNHLSTFVVACALIWICSVEAVAVAGEIVADAEPDCFGFMVDCRGRFLNPPLPANYFGNCVAPVTVELKHGELEGHDGFAIAVESIGEKIREKLQSSGKEILECMKEWSEYRNQLVSKRQCWVAGSPKFDFYAVDFGWGRPTKLEGRLTTNDDAFTLSKSRDFEGGLEISLSKPIPQMEAFATAFSTLVADIMSLQQLK